MTVVEFLLLLIKFWLLLFLCKFCLLGIAIFIRWAKLRCLGYEHYVRWDFINVQGAIHLVVATTIYGDSIEVEPGNKVNGYHVYYSTTWDVISSVFKHRNYIRCHQNWFITSTNKWLYAPDDFGNWKYRLVK